MRTIHGFSKIVQSLLPVYSHLFYMCTLEGKQVCTTQKHTITEAHEKYYILQWTAGESKKYITIYIARGFAVKKEFLAHFGTRALPELN